MMSEARYTVVDIPRETDSSQFMVTLQRGVADDTRFDVGTEVIIRPADEDARTPVPEELLAELERVIEPNAGNQDFNMTSRDVAALRRDAIGRVLPYLRPAAKPSRPDPDPDEMTPEELKAELDAAEGVEWLPYQVTFEDGAVWHYAAVTLHGELIKNVNGKSREQVLRNAVRALRKLPNIECPQCGWNAVNATWYEGEPGRCFYTCPECGCDPDNLREHLDAQEDPK